MATVDVDTIAADRWTSGSSQLSWSKGRRPPVAVLYSSNEQGELLQLCYDDSTVNIGLGIIIIVVLLLYVAVAGIIPTPRGISIRLAVWLKSFQLTNQLLTNQP